MNWKLKAHVLALLSRMPRGRLVYHRLQSWLGTNKLDAPEYVSRALEIVALIQEAGREPRHGVYLEIGTGWRPFLPFVFCLIGAERVITLDVNPWLTKAYALETYRSLAPHLHTIAERLGLKADDLQRRYEAILPRASDLSSLLQACGVDYRCPCDAGRTGLADGSVDYVISSNVLEHVPPELLRSFHAEAARILKPAGLAVHRINPGDHFSGVDRSITAANFLQYSARQWRWYGGSGLAYHNRLRCAQHRDLFEAVGFRILTSRVRVDPPSLRAIQEGRLRIDPAYAAFSAEELAADYIWIVATPPQKRPAVLPS